MNGAILLDDLINLIYRHGIGTEYVDYYSTYINHARALLQSPVRNEKEIRNLLTKFVSTHEQYGFFLPKEKYYEDIFDRINLYILTPEKEETLKLVESMLEILDEYDTVILLVDHELQQELESWEEHAERVLGIWEE